MKGWVDGLMLDMSKNKSPAFSQLLLNVGLVRHLFFPNFIMSLWNFIIRWGTLLLDGELYYYGT